MLIKEFDKEIVNNFYGYFVLENVGKNTDEISIFVKKINEDKNYESKVDAYRLPDGKVLICFISGLDLISLNNLVASDGESEEIINLQVFERIRRYFDMPKDNNKGGFLFHNSIPVWDSWRCHFDKYGPETFTKNGEDPTPLVSNLEDLYIYEPVFSVNSLAHIIYAHANIDEDFLINRDPFPRVARTLQESLKQVVEWSDVSQDPWNNTEEISNKATQFLKVLNFSEDFKNHVRETQPDMQVFKYLKGKTNARKRPTMAGDFTEQMKNEILKKLSHCSLSNILTIFNSGISPEDLQYIREKEIELVQKAQENILKSAGNTVDKINDSNIDHVKDKLRENSPEMYGLLNVFAEVYSNHMSMLEQTI